MHSGTFFEGPLEQEKYGSVNKSLTIVFQSLEITPTISGIVRHRQIHPIVNGPLPLPIQ